MLSLPSLAAPSPKRGLECTDLAGLGLGLGLGSGSGLGLRFGFGFGFGLGLGLGLGFEALHLPQRG